MTLPTFDLQSHSRCSDGVLSPAEVVDRAVAAGVRLLALTDHDTVDGVAEAREAARAHGIGFSPASEITAVDGPQEDIHVLGYEIDVTHPGLLDSLAEWRSDRERRIYLMVDRMRDLGWEIDTAAIDERERAGLPIGRPHGADAVLGHPRNQDRLTTEGIEGKRELFPAYLVPGAPGFVPRTRPTIEEAVQIIHAAGGLAVWAHPYWYAGDPEEALQTLGRYAAAGMDGVEAFYRSHTPEQTELLCDAAAGRGMLTTGSPDFHRPEEDVFLGFELYGREPNLGPIGSGSA